MHDESSIYDPDSLEYLAPETQEKVLETRKKCVEAIAALAGPYAVAKHRVHARLTALNGAMREAQIAWADSVVFQASAGAQAIGASKLKVRALAVALILAAFAETYFAFPGVRFATGQMGQINSPLEDPLSLMGAAVIGVMSLAAAHMAGQHFSWSERSLMREPEPATVSNEMAAPPAVRADPENAKLIETSPLDFAGPAPIDAGAAFSSFDTSTLAVPPSKEVSDEEKKRHEHTLRGGRSQKLCRAIGIGLVGAGILLWTFNGMMRAGYLQKLPTPSAPSAGGLLGGAPPPTTPAGISDGTLELAIIGFSMLIFLLTVGIVFAMHTPAELRSKELARRREEAEATVLEKIKDAETAVRAFEELRSQIHVQRVTGQITEDIARLPTDEA